MSGEHNEQEKYVQQIYNYAADLLIKQKQSRETVIQVLVSRGIDQGTASTIVDNIEKQKKVAVSERARKDMLYGALWCVGGIIVTAATYSAASGGGRYVIAWGAIIFGAIQFFKGVAKL